MRLSVFPLGSIEKFILTTGELTLTTHSAVIVLITSLELINTAINSPNDEILFPKRD